MKEALSKIDTNGDGKIDFAEFQEMNRLFPRLLYPAFRVQENMMEFTLGGEVWKNRRSALEEDREKVKGMTDEMRKLEEKRKMRIRAERVKRKMGFFSYYCCCSKRQPYFDAFEREERELREKEAQKKAKIKKSKEVKAQAKVVEEKIREIEKIKEEEPAPPITREERRSRSDDRRNKRKDR